MDPILDQLAEAITDSKDLEGLVRPLLALLESVTGLESTYLTTIDLDRRVQRIVFARNTQTMQIPEGLEVPWDDTLCKRALEENRPYVDNVEGCWGDSEAARALGIKTYLSAPVRMVTGELYGTLCAAGTARTPVSGDAQRLLGAFARLVAHQLEREQLIDRLQMENAEFSRHALSDPLTGMPNRRALMNELARTLAHAARAGSPVYVVFVDLDGFKAINDRFGHDAGDRFLIAVARSLTDGMRNSDFIARYGGDEFVMFALAQPDDPEEASEVLRNRLVSLTTGQFPVGTHMLDYSGASVGVVTSEPGELDCGTVLARADAAMYAAKQARRAQGHEK